MPKVKIILNGVQVAVEQNTSLSQLVSQLELDLTKIAIEKDLEIINGEDFPTTFLDEGSHVEIVHFIGGG